MNHTVDSYRRTSKKPDGNMHVPEGYYSGGKGKDGSRNEK